MHAEMDLVYYLIVIWIELFFASYVPKLISSFLKISFPSHFLRTMNEMLLKIMPSVEIIAGIIPLSQNVKASTRELQSSILS